MKNIILSTLLAGCLFALGCSTAKKSPPLPKVGFVDGKYYLSESEKAMTPDQLRAAIEADATVAAELRAQETARAVGRTAAAVAVGLAFGQVHVGSPVQDRPAARAKIKMQAYSDRLVELGEPAVDPETVMAAAISARKQKKTASES